ncbi:MAG: hypothetical protein A2Y95_01505 [Deltaproteobacteria bacterium RBG_13_65_10]|nr:MAG: hypothetical protein A2Y95_01505 [Deltaproteobacteria bacterium RBG_13_65_10]
MAATRALIFNNRLDAAVTAAFMSLVVLIVLTSARRWVEALSRGPRSEIVPGERVVSVSEGRPDL